MLDDRRVHDPYRINYLRSHIGKVREAIAGGVDVMGYLVGRCVDSVSASTAHMSKRHGLIHVDRDDNGSRTLECTGKDSFLWY